MSYSASIYKFVEGIDVPVALDIEVVRAVLDPYAVGDPNLLVMEDGTLQFWVRATDGSEVEIFADETGILLERPHSGSGVFAIVAELVARLGAVIFEPREGVFLCDAEVHAYLAPDLKKNAVLTELTGAAVEAALGSVRRIMRGGPPAPNRCSAPPD